MVFQQHGVNYHKYADDKQAYADASIRDVKTIRATLENCISNVLDCCSSRRLQLNVTKMELIWFGSHHNLSKLSDTDLTLDIDILACVPSNFFAILVSC